MDPKLSRGHTQHARSARVAAVSGAAGGIGSAVARLLGGKGYDLLLNDIDEAGLERVAAELQGRSERNAGAARSDSRSVNELLRGDRCDVAQDAATSQRSRPRIETLACDLTADGAPAAFIGAAVERFGALDVLVNNAGIIRPGRFAEGCEADDRRQLEVNLISVIACTRAAIAAMKGRGGHIVTISSLAGIVPESGGAVYSASKFALRGFDLALGAELRDEGIFVSTVFPDAVDTAMLRAEALAGGSPISFVSPPLSPQTVAAAVLRALEKKRPEIYLPASSGAFARLASCFPAAAARLWPLLERAGEKNRVKFVRRLGLDKEQA